MNKLIDIGGDEYPKRNNWFLFLFRECMETAKGDRQYIDKKKPEEPQSIDQFSYHKYMCPELYNEK